MALYEKTKMELTSAISQMTGYFGGIAKYDDSVPVRTRVRMLQALIDYWTQLDPDSDTTKAWVQEWKDEIKKISE